MFRLVFIFIFVLQQVASLAQQSNSLYLMHRIPQANLLNPAVQIECPVYVGVPFLSSLHLNLNSTGFSYNDIAMETSANFPSLVLQMHSWDYLSGELHYTPVSFGFMYDNEQYFNFAWTERVESKLFVSKKLMSLLANGNTQFVGPGMVTSNPGINGFYYREFSFGYSYELQSNTLVGLHAKVLFGLGGVFTRRKTIDIDIDALTYNIDAQWNPKVDVSYPLTVSTDAEGNVTGVGASRFSPLPFFLNFSNPGFAFDLGFIKPGDRVTWSGSILDLGFIWWSGKSSRFSNQGHFIFRGATPDDLLDPAAYIDMLADSINNQVQFQHQYSGFTTLLNPKAYLGATYDINKNLQAGAVFRTEWYPGRPVMGFTLLASAITNKGSALSLTYTIQNGSFANIGAALNLGGERFQFYLLSDNLLAPFFPEKVRNANLRFGFNMFWGCIQKKKKVKKLTSGCGCFWDMSLTEKRRQHGVKK